MVDIKKNKKSCKLLDGNQKNVCTHANKSVKYEAVCNSFRHMKLGYCKDCNEKETKEKDSETMMSTCICLQCGSQFCSSQCPHQHALKHYKDTPSHPVCINITTWVVWCYECDTEVSEIEKFPTAIKTVEFLKRKIVSGKSPKCSLNINLHVENVQSVLKGEASVKGLKNLGNTCFFNSVVQNMARLHMLHEKLECSFNKKSYISLKFENQDLNVEVKEPPGSLTSSLHNLLNEMNISSSKIINPSKLLGEVSKKAPQFRGYQQHDSHELLRYLLDSIRTEEIKRVEASLKEVLTPLSNCINNVNDAIKVHLKSAKTHIDEVFGGVFVSTICCQQCKEKSRVYEEFLDLSLPVSTVDNPKKEKKSNLTSKDEKPLSKHQQKMKVKQARKGKRSRNRSQSKSENNTPNKEAEKKDSTKNNENLQTLPSEDGKSESQEQNNLTISFSNIENKHSENENSCSSEQCAMSLLTEKTVAEETAEIKDSRNVDRLNDGLQISNLVEEGLNCESKNLKSPFQDLAQKEQMHPDATYSNSPCFELIKINENDQGSIHGAPHKICNFPVDGDHLSNSFKEILPEDTKKRDSLEYSSGDNKNNIAADLNYTSFQHKKLTSSVCSEGGYESIDSTNDMIPAFSELQIDGSEPYCKVDLIMSSGSDSGRGSTNSVYKDVKCNEDERVVDFEHIHFKENHFSDGVEDDEISVKSENSSDEEEFQTTLAPSYTVKPNDNSIEGILQQFFSVDILDGANKFLCEHCAGTKSDGRQKGKEKVFTVATKQLLVQKLPAILTLHLKRFEQVGGGRLRKITKLIQFPKELNMAPFCSSFSDCQKDSVKYILSGLIEHSGGLHGGHYVAYVKTKSDQKNRWYCVSDSDVSHVSEEQVLSKQAYLLFYERLLQT